MLFCPKCGTQNQDGAAFCGQCGAPFPQAGATRQDPAVASNAVSTGQPTAAPAPYTAAAAPVASQPAAPAPAPKKGKLPFIIAAAVVLVAIVVLVVVFVIPRCSGGAVAGSATLTTLNTASTSEAQATLDKMKSGNVEGFKYYASSDDAVSFVNETVDRARSGSIRQWSDVMNADVAKKLNGQWWLVAAADSSFAPYVQQYKSEYGIDLGHMTVYATVVSDDDLTNEEVANLVSGAGLTYEHAVVQDAKISEVMSYLREYSTMLASSAGSSYYGYSAQSIDRDINMIASQAEGIGVKSVSIGQYYGEKTIGISAAVQFDSYAIVVVWSDDPASYGMDSLINADTVNRMYVK